MVPMSVALFGTFAQSGACVISPFHMYGCFENSLFSNTFAGSKCPLLVRLMKMLNGILGVLAHF